MIVDDEVKLQEVLKIKLEKYCSNISVVDSAMNVSEAYDKLKTIDIDILFLDISMPGETGFDLLEKLDNIHFEIIFVTGFSEYAIQALKVSAVDYLLKPLNTEDLIIAVARAVDRIANRKEIERYKVLKHNLSHSSEKEKRIAIPGSTAYEFVTISDIVHCEGWEKYTRIHLTNSEVILSSYNIGVFKDLLESYGFYSSHKSHLINTDKIKRYLKEGIVVLEGDMQVPVSRRKKDEFLEKYVKNLLK